MDVSDYTYAFFTALFRAIVWSVLGFLTGWIPALARAIVLPAYLALIKRCYPGVGSMRWGLHPLRGSL